MGMVILTILKIIGIILLVVLGLILFLLLLVLFVPIRYRIDASKDAEGEQQIHALIKVTWLLHLLNMRFCDGGVGPAVVSHDRIQQKQGRPEHFHEFPYNVDLLFIS